MPAETAPCPDGIEPLHIRPRHGLYRHASPLSLLLLLAILTAAMLGLFGGQSNRDIRRETTALRIDVNLPEILRNGEFFESRITIMPGRPITRLVLGISPALWRDMTINSMIPAASAEKSEAGLFRFDYGPARPGEPIEIKIDGQINPPLFGGTAGDIAVFDDTHELIRIPVAIEVRP